MKVEPERVIAAIIAANPKLKLDYAAIAQMYGEGAKYNTMEHKFRAWRKQAEALRNTAGEETTQVQPQTTPRAPRTLTAGGKKSGTPSKSKTAKTADAEAVADADAAVVDISGEDLDPIKPEIKLENEATRSLLGIKNYALHDTQDDDDVQVLDEHASKRLKVELDMDDTPAKIPSFKAERGTRIDSQARGYDLSLPSMTVTAVDDGDETVLTNLKSLVHRSGASDPVFGNEA